MKSLLYCRDPGKAGQNFVPAKRDHVITPRKIISLETTKTVELKNIVLLVAKKMCEAQLT